MSISPCNNLNVKTHRVSQLASLAGGDITDDDLVQISHKNGGLYYTKNTTISSLNNKISDYLSSLPNGRYSGSFKGNLSGSSYLYGATVENLIAESGQFTGSALISSGQFTGSFTGSFTGNFGGSLVGNITSSTITTTTAGVDSGYYIPIKIGSINYKIKLYDNT